MGRHRVFNPDPNLVLTSTYLGISNVLVYSIMPIPVILLANLTNEGSENLDAGEQDLSPECIEQLLQKWIYQP